MNNPFQRPFISPNEVVEVLKKVRPNEERDLSQIYNVSIMEEGRLCHIAAHLPLFTEEGKVCDIHLYYLVTVDRGLFNQIICQDSNVSDAIYFKTAQDAKERAVNYLRHLLNEMK